MYDLPQNSYKVNLKSLVVQVACSSSPKTKLQWMYLDQACVIQVGRLGKIAQKLAIRHAKSTLTFTTVKYSLLESSVCNLICKHIFILNSL